MEQKEGMRQKKRRVPVTHSPWQCKALQYASVFYKKGEILSTFRIVYLAVSIDKSTEDTSHACFLILRKMNIIHDFIGLLKGFTGMLTSEPVAELQQKTQSTGLWGKSFGTDRRFVFGQETLPYSRDLIHFSRCKDK